jgi:hypothetical protein
MQPAKMRQLRQALLAQRGEIPAHDYVSGNETRAESVRRIYLLRAPS